MIERIGPYRLLEEIGRGGMGAVYLAERDTDFTHRVAIKMVSGLLDADTERRFASERRILASLDHPAIARLLDGGSTPEAVPYLVMEHVEGVPIDRYCETKALSTTARVELFLGVCDAVSHAHRRLVVHRDLKPSNILVTSGGFPKLLDFGIATLLDDRSGDASDGSADARTRGSVRVLTAQYASPEQLRGERVTTASDVYALGVVLYEVLAGRRPYDVEGQPAHEVERLVCRQDPPRPRIGGDIETIVMKALRKEPEQRYSSVDALADDLRRYLDGRPVMARPATLAYVARRFVTRHPGRAAAAAAFVATVAVFGSALAWSAARARHERDAAERVTSGLIQMFSGSGLRSPDGNTITVRELIDRDTATLARQAGDRPDVATWRGEDVIDSPAAALVLTRLASTLLARRQLAAAEAAARRAVAMRRRIFGPRNPLVGESLDTLSLIVYARGRREEAARLFVEVADLFRSSLGPTHPMVATALHHLAIGSRDAGDLAGAERLLLEAIAIRRWIVGQTAWDVEMLLADIVNREGRPEESERLLRDAVEAIRAGRHPRLEDAEHRLAGQRATRMR